MKSQWTQLLVITCLGSSLLGCQQRSEFDETSAATASSSGEQAQQSADSGDSGAVPNSPAGWQTYESAEGGFTVMAPGDPTEASSDEPKMWKLKRFTFQDGTTPLVIELYSDRTGAVATNTVDDLRDSPDIVAGTLQDASLPGMPGIEFRTNGRVGEVVHREYCAPNNERSISMFVQKDVGSGLSEQKIRLFLDSFQLKN